VKKIMHYGFLILLFAGFVSALHAEKMRVLVEGEEEVSSATPDRDGVYIKEENPGILNKRKLERKKKTEELKQLAEKSSAESEIEKEVMDAIILKIIDIEQELDRQDRMQLYTIIGGLVLFGVLAALILIRDRD